MIVGMVEPPNLNVVRRESGPALWIGRTIILGAYSVDPKGAYVPSLIAREPHLTTRPFSLTYTIQPRARWSDGVPVTARDFVFTWQVEVNPTVKLEPGLRAGYERIVSARILGPKRVKFVFDKPYSAWKTLFDFVLPWHALRGQDANEIWQDAIDDPRAGLPISNGPFIFKSWSRGHQLTLVRNPRFWRRKAYLSSLVFHFLPDPPSQLAALRARQVDMILPPPASLAPADLRGGPGLRAASGPANVWEHLDFNLGPKANRALRNPFVRKAIAYAIDRKALAAELAQKFMPGLKLLQSAVFQPYSPAYERHWQLWQYRPRTALAILRSHGCRRGQDGIFTCGGARLPFRLGTTAGNPPRQLTFERVQAQLARVGIELEGDFEPSALAFRRLQESDWDLFLFSWLVSPDQTQADVDFFGCRGKLNYNAYCNARVSKHLGAASTEPRFDRRAALVNRADALMAKDVPLLPLYAKTGYVIHNRRIRNVVWNPDVDRLVFWNAQDWWIAQS